MASRDDKERQRRRHLAGAEREIERQDNRKRARERRRSGDGGGGHSQRGASRRSTDWDDWDDGDDGGPATGDLPEAFERIRSKATKSPRPERGAMGARATIYASGLVVARHRGACEVLRDGREERAPIHVPLHSMHTHGPSGVQDDVVVGDRVDLGVGAADGAFCILRRAPRRNVLERSDPGDPQGRRKLVLAADVDVLVGVQPASRPRPGLIDRLAVAAAGLDGVEMVVCLHKIDLLEHDDELRALAAVVAQRARACGARLVRTRCGDGDGTHDVEELRTAIGTRRAVLVGPSGAGKSSLANALIPTLAQRTQSVRVGDGKGRHTTTSSGLFAIEGGGALIDTPGVRAFGLDRPGPEVLAKVYPEIAAAARSCRFRDCGHEVEPDCAVRAAVEAGSVLADRLAAWLRLVHGDGD